MHNIKKAIEEAFEFLTNSGYLKEIFERNSELNIRYSKNEFQIVVIHDLGIYDFLKMKSKYFVTVIIRKSGSGRSLLDCDDLFGKDKIDKLKFDISAKSVLEQISLYAEFIELNIGTLNKLID